MSEDFESILHASSTQLKTLNTRITQKACKDLDILRGWLQTAGQLRAITKQDAVDFAIKYACSAICEQMERKGYITIDELEKSQGGAILDVSEPLTNVSDPMSVSEPSKIVTITRLPNNAEEIKARYGIR